MTKVLESTILRVIEATNVRHETTLIGLADGVHMYRLKVDSEPAKVFTDNINSSAMDQINAYVAERKRNKQLAAVQAVLAEAKTAKKSIDLLGEMAKHPGWSLDQGHIDRYDEESDYGWCVYEAFGGRSDRDWELIGFGETPAKALEAALSRK